MSSVAPHFVSVPRDRPHTIDSDVSHLAQLSQGFRDDWRCLLREGFSVMIEGPDDATEAALSLLKPHLRQPIMWQQPGELRLSAVVPGALVIRQVDAMTVHDQARLLERLGPATATIQIVSTTRAPLFDLVEAGGFDRTLYYRLNVALFRVGIDVSPERAAAR